MSNKENENLGPVVATNLNLGNVGKIDSKLNQDFSEKLAAVILDCLENPESNKNRKLSLVFNFAPNKDDPLDVNMSAQVTSSTAPRVFDVIVGQANKTNKTIQFSHHQNELFSDYIDGIDVDEDDGPLDGKAKAAGE